ADRIGRYTRHVLSRKTPPEGDLGRPGSDVRPPPVSGPADVVARWAPRIRLAGRVLAGEARGETGTIAEAPGAFDALSDDAACKFYCRRASAPLTFPRKFARTSRESRLLISVMT